MRKLNLKVDKNWVKVKGNESKLKKLSQSWDNWALNKFKQSWK